MELIANQALQKKKITELVIITVKPSKMKHSEKKYWKINSKRQNHTDF